MRRVDGINMSFLSKLQETVKERSLVCCSPWVAELGHDLTTEYVTCQKKLKIIFEYIPHINLV